MPSNPGAVEPRVTIIDLLDNVLDGELTAERASTLTDRELRDLAEALEQFYASWEPPSPNEGEVRAYPGGWVAANYGSPEAKALLGMNLLYFHSVLIHDPVGEWFDPRRSRLQAPPPVRYRNRSQLQSAEAHLLRNDGYYYTRTSPDRTREQLKWMLPMLADFRPLILAGIAIPFNQIGTLVERQKSILVAVRHDLEDAEFLRRLKEPVDLPPVNADFARGLNLELKGARGAVAADAARVIAQNPSFYLNKTLAFAEATGSRYTPPAATDLALYERRLERVGEELSRKANLDLRVAAALSRSQLPFIRDMSSRTLVEIRQQDEAFDDWRAELRTAVRQIETAPASEDFADEAKEVFSDCIAPRAAEVRRALDRSAVLRSSSRDATLSLVTGVAVAGTAALAGVSPPIAAATAGTSAIARWALGALFPPRQAGARAIMATLLRDGGPR